MIKVLGKPTPQQIEKLRKLGLVIPAYFEKIKDVKPSGFSKKIFDCKCGEDLADLLR